MPNFKVISYDSIGRVIGIAYMHGATRKQAEHRRKSCLA